MNEIEFGKFYLRELIRKRSRKLKELCLEKILENLYLNYFICVYHNLRLPSIVSDRLFEKFGEKIENYDDMMVKSYYGDQVKIFQKGISSLTRLTINYGLCWHPNFFVKLDKTSIKDIKFRQIFQRQTTDNQLIVKNILTGITSLRSINLSPNFKFEWAYYYLVKSSSTLEEITIINDYDQSTLMLTENLIKRCSILKELCIHTDGLHEYNFVNILKYLLKFEATLERLEFFGNCIATSKPIDFLNSIPKFKNLREIKFRHCANIFFRYFEMGRYFPLRMREFRLELNFHKIPSNLTNLRKITLISCNLRVGVCIKLARVFARFNNIEEIDLGYNISMDNGLFCILNALENSKTNLKKISLEFCCLFVSQCVALGRPFSKFSYLHEVSLKGNKSFDTEYIDFLNALKTSSRHLQKLYFSDAGLCQTTKDSISNFVKTSLGSCEVIF